MLEPFLDSIEQSRFGVDPNETAALHENVPIAERSALLIPLVDAAASSQRALPPKIRSALVSLIDTLPADLRQPCAAALDAAIIDVTAA